jgi:hypothetical protein
VKTGLEFTDLLFLDCWLIRYGQNNDICCFSILLQLFERKQFTFVKKNQQISQSP